MQARNAHWVKPNEQERIPHRFIVFDTESHRRREGVTETQTWRLACAVRWRTDLKTTTQEEWLDASTPEQLWEWVSEWCRKGTRTVVWCHNLSYDARISRLFDLLPKHGFTLEWFNLDASVSCATWRSDHGTLVFADT